VVEESKGVRLVEEGKEHELAHPRVEPFWQAFADAAG